MKKTGLMILIPALMLALMPAAPAEPLSFEEVVEQVAVPLALANDPRVGINNEYSAEELAEVVRAMNENGIVLPENSMVMQMMTNGLGLYESTVIREFCDEAFGGEDDSWTLEELAWHGQIEVRIGSMEKAYNAVPGPENMTVEEAEALAAAAVRAAYGQDLALEDRNLWKPGRQFTIGDAEDPEPRWNFWWLPRDLEHGHYSAEFRDGDAPEEVSVYAEVTDWTQPYTGEELMTRIWNVWSWSQQDWTQDVWRELHDRMQQAVPDPDNIFYTEYEGYRLTGYPDPDGNDISREEAIRTAKEALKKDRAALDSAVLTEYGGERSWLVGLVIYGEGLVMSGEDTGFWVADIDSRTGKVRSIGEARGEQAFIPEAAYRKAAEGVTEDTTDYIGIAAEAVKAQYPGVDPLDETAYTASVSGLYTHYVDFVPKSIRYGRITAADSSEGAVTEMDADVGEPDGDNLFDRYWAVYGYYANWDQDRWIQLERDMADQDPLTPGGKALKATHYPEEDSVKIGKEEAKELAILASGERTAEPHTCVLVDARPHPVWILRVITRTGTERDPVFGIDAETGETVFTEWYVIDETPHYVMYSLPETWKKVTEDRKVW